MRSSIVSFIFCSFLIAARAAQIFEAGNGFLSSWKDRAYKGDGLILKNTSETRRGPKGCSDRMYASSRSPRLTCGRRHICC